MINFPSSTFTWKNFPHKREPYYKFMGGFVGKDEQVYHVRFNIEAMFEIRDEATGAVAEHFVSAPCRTEYTIANRNLFQIPSSEFRMAFSRSSRLTIARRPSTEQEPINNALLTAAWQDHKIDIRTFSSVTELKTAREVIDATLANDKLNARSTYRDARRGLTVTVEYPVNLINLNVEDGEFQVCTGPVIVPDLNTWDGKEIQRVFLAHVAISAFDWVEFVLCREIDAAPEERAWLDVPRGRDRLELRDPNVRPANYPPARPKPTVYNEVWEMEATNVLLQAKNP